MARIANSSISYGLALAASLAVPSRSQLPKDFVEKVFAPAASFAEATSMAHADDGRIFVSERGGNIKIIKGDNATVVTKINTTTNREQGLLKIVAHPGFASKSWLYAFHISHDYKKHYITRIKVNAASEVASIDTVVRLPDLENTGRHNGGGMAFGKDGFLYVGRGNDELGGGANPAASWTSVKGKILRYTEEGAPAPGNPKYATGANDGEKSIWARGFRNPWTMTADLISGRIFVGDVGDGTESIEEITAPDPAKDYWYGYGQGGGDGVGTAGGKAIDPFAFYPTGSAGGEKAIVAQVPYNAAAKSNWPAEYKNRLYTADFGMPAIRSVPLDKPAGSVNMQSGAGAVLFYANNSKTKVGMGLGVDGNLYYVDYNGGKAYQISYTGAPAVTLDPSEPILRQRAFALRMASVGDLEFEISGGAGLQGAADIRLTILEPNGKVRFQGAAEIDGSGVRASGFRPVSAGLHVCRLTWTRDGAARQALGRLMVLP